MKEQDFIHTIDEKTKNIPIPDSISPDSMKKMLDEHINSQSSGSDTNTTNSDSSKTGHNRKIRRLTVAACITLCLAGSLGVSKLIINTPDKMAETQNVTVSGYSENDECEEDSKDSGENLIAQTTLKSPSSYSEYYDTLKSAYDEYYNSLAQVDSEIMYKESADTVRSVTEAVAEESVESTKMMEDLASSDTNGEVTQKSAAKETGSNKNYSSTNTQEKTVDEGDIIKTDGNYIYKVISCFNNDTGYTDQKLTITKADDGNLSAVTTINLNDLLKKGDNDYVDFQEFYLHQTKSKDYLVLMYSKQSYNFDDSSDETYIVLYDITNREKPKKVKTLSQSGMYESSRISDGYLYTVSNFYDTTLETEKPYTNYIPSINGKTIDCSRIYYPDNILMETTYVVTSLDLSNPVDFTDSKAIPTRGGETYVSDSSIYFYTTLYEKVNKTEIMKVRYEKGILTPANSATITGYLYDSFALSEYNGYLRIVATIPANNISLLRFEDLDLKSNDNSIAKDAESEVVKEDVNVLYILNDAMELTGKIAGLAPGERIYSARFMGDIGYFVTFRNTDPLFSVDLSDPENPVILGKLKIPGFSNYLHFYDDGLLLGLGEEIDPNTQEFLGLKLSMFDTSDPADVTEQDKFIIEDSQFSSALYNHKAIMIDPEKNILGFLYYAQNYNKNYSSGHYYYATYTFDKEKGFVETARYSIEDGSEFETDGVRGLYIGEYFYLCTNKTITSYEIGSQEPIAQVYFK